ncbi:MAG TPA: glycosyltransferase family 9 protein [Caulobacteraceae bacterium]|jgi:tetratricopeptide (TPR) repeat protein|nr:glycosyltransferase family 9 protein [Caulobacteraceae bacterium]
MSVDAALQAWREGRAEDCMAQLRALGVEAADQPIALQLWALATAATGRRADALALLERAVRIAPGDAQAHFNLAVSLQAISEMTRAVTHYEQVLRIEPAHTGALNNLSDLYRRRGRPAEGWGLMARYQAAGGGLSGLEIRMAKLAMDLRRFDEAAQWFDRAEQYAPGDASVGWEHAMLDLVREDFANGWPRYERRLESYGFNGLGIYPYAAPRWTGEPIAGKRLLIHREQGLGDAIMFSTAFEGLIEDGAQLHLALAPPLARLMAFNFPKARAWSSVTATGGNGRQPEQRWAAVAGPIDLQAPVCSLGVLRMMDGPPAPRAYLRADPADVGVWAERLATLQPKKPRARRIGLALGTRQVRWNDDGQTQAIRKTLPAAMAAPFAEIKRAQWVALHDRETASMLADVPALDIVDPSPWITDLADTAAIIETLDLVVSADTAVAHLAAAMGKPVILMLWWNADWRWGVSRADSYWYPQVQVVRQAAPGDWAGVVKAVAAAIG